MKRTLVPALVLLFASAAAAQTAAPGSADSFALSGHEQLTVNDKPAPEARFYRQVAGIPRLLIQAPELPDAILITAGQRPTATVVPPDAIAPSPGDPDAVLLSASDAAPRHLPVFLSGQEIKVTFGAARLVVGPREPLVGELDPAAILAYMPEYRRNRSTYAPIKGAMRLLETCNAPTDVEVFFGTWCPHCEQLIPRLIRVVQDLKNPNLRFHFHGMPRKLDEDPVGRQYKVDAVPVGVVRRGSDIVARLSGKDWEAPESALAALLFGEAGADRTAAP